MSKNKNPIFKMRPLCAAVLVAMASPIVSAQEQESQGGSEGAEQTLPPVPVYGEREHDFAAGVSSVGGAVPTPIRDVPQSVTVINRAVMESQGITTLTEALRNTPGITLAAGEGGNIGDNVNIRGYSARTDLFLDGVRDRGQYARETFFLEAVEVLRGPSSMLFGRGSTGGVINQVSKQASLREHTEIGLGAGTDAYYRATLDVNRKLSDSSAYRVAVLRHNNESTRDIIESKRSGLAGSLRFGIRTPTEVAVSAIIQRRDDIPDYGVPVGIAEVDSTDAPVVPTIENPGHPIATNRDNFYGFTDDTFEQNVDVFRLNIEHKFYESLSLNNQTQYNAVTLHAMPTRVNLGGAAIIETEFARDRRERNIDDESLYNQTDLVIRIGDGAVRHTLTVGAEIGNDYYKNQTYDWTTTEPPQSIESPVYGPMPSTIPRTATTLTDSDGDTTAFYINEQLDLGEHWKIIAGVRKEEFELTSTVINNPTAAQNGIFARDDSMTSYRAGIIYQPSDTQSYYVGYGTSFNPSTEAVTLSLANMLVKPEENQSLEIGAKWDLLDGGLALTVALFEVEKTNARNTDPLTDLVELDGATAVEGFEIGVGGHLTPNWQIFAGYTNLEGEIIRLDNSDGLSLDGNVLQNTPEDTASLWTTYELGAWEIGGGTVYSSERLLNNDNTAVTDGYTRFDATAAWQYADQYQLRLNLQNLTDEEYFEVATGGRATPTNGMQAVLTWTADF